jgi:NADPH:quinone reductase-like Zn-dependent oxidoreductase
MHALRLHQQAAPEGLCYEEAPIPEPGTGDLLVRVHAASFTPTELAWPSTWVDRLGHDRRPVIPGHEVSGTVEGLGWGTTGFAVGDAVYGLTDWYRDGTLAEYVAVEARNLAPKPASLDHVQAAALPMPGLTAWQALFVHGGLSGGQRVLLHGAGGGVGTVAVQLARAAGAHVIATGRAWARELVTDLGAERFVDLDRERFEQVAEAVDLVVDLVGGETLRRSGATVREGGHRRLRRRGSAGPAGTTRRGPRGVLRGRAGSIGAPGARPPGGRGRAAARGGRGGRPRRRSQGVPGQARRARPGEGGASDLGPVSTGTRTAPRNSGMAARRADRRSRSSEPGEPCRERSRHAAADHRKRRRRRCPAVPPSRPATGEEVPASGGRI